MTLPIPPEYLPAVVGALRADGVAYLNVEANQYTMPSAYTSLPEWRALADATCGTCFDDDWPAGTSEPYEDCSECRGTGKPIHTLTVDCPACKGYGWCDNDVSVDVVVAELVPVEEWDEQDYPVILLGGGTGLPYLYVPWPNGSDGTSTQITPLGPPPPLSPGDWVARLEVAP